MTFLILLAAVETRAAVVRTDIRLGMTLEPPHLDPTASAAGAVDEIVYANIFEGLMRIDATGAIRPALARSWDISPDGLTYVFRLASGVTFHDGSPFDAEDVKFSLDRARSSESTNAQKMLFADIAAVEVVSPLVVKVTLSRPNGDFLFGMALGDAVILSPETARSNVAHPIGTGPFEFVEWERGNRITIARNPDYWGSPVKLDRVEFRFIADPAAAFAAMMAQDIDVFPDFPAPELLPHLRADPRFSVVIGSTEGETILAINNARKPFDDIRIRQAISHAIDRESLIKGAMFGYAIPIGTHFAPHDPAYVDLTAWSAHDPDKARRLLAESGFADGFAATLTLPPPAYARRAGEIIAAQLRSVGIKLRIVNMEWARWLERVFQGKDFDLTLVAHTEARDIGIYARPDYYFGYKSDEFNRIMVLLNDMVDPMEREALLRTAQRRIARDYVNAYLFQLARIGVADVRLKGLWPDAPIQANDLTAVHWQEASYEP